MKKIYLYVGVLFYSLFSTVAYATNDSGESQQMPWETMIEKLGKSLGILGYGLCIIGIIWAGYGFVVQGEKESGFKRLLTTLVGACVIFGAKKILDTMVGVHF